MNVAHLEVLRREFPARRFELAAGLSDDALRGIEEDFGFVFPPDLRMLLKAFVPRGPDFPDWHAPHSQDLIEWIDMPAEGLAFDVEENGFWRSSWGARPDDDDDAVEEARRHVSLAPLLIPVFSNHFLPARPAEEGNPVLSVMQSDIAVAAPDLGWFFHDETGVPAPPWPRRQPRRIEFWSDLLRR